MKRMYNQVCDKCGKPTDRGYCDSCEKFIGED